MPTQCPWNQRWQRSQSSIITPPSSPSPVPRPAPPHTQCTRSSCSQRGRGGGGASKRNTKLSERNQSFHAFTLFARTLPERHARTKCSEDPRACRLCYLVSSTRERSRHVVARFRERSSSLRAASFTPPPGPAVHRTHLVAGPPTRSRPRSLGKNHRAFPLSPIVPPSASTDQKTQRKMQNAKSPSDLRSAQVLIHIKLTRDINEEQDQSKTSFNASRTGIFENRVFSAKSECTRANYQHDQKSCIQARQANGASGEDWLRALKPESRGHGSSSNPR